VPGPSPENRSANTLGSALWSKHGAANLWRTRSPRWSIRIEPDAPAFVREDGWPVEAGQGPPRGYRWPASDGYARLALGEVEGRRATMPANASSATRVSARRCPLRAGNLPF